MSLHPTPPNPLRNALSHTLLVLALVGPASAWAQHRIVTPPTRISSAEFLRVTISNSSQSQVPFEGACYVGNGQAVGESNGALGPNQSFGYGFQPSNLGAIFCAVEWTGDCDAVQASLCVDDLATSTKLDCLAGGVRTCDVQAETTAQRLRTGVIQSARLRPVHCPVTNQGTQPVTVAIRLHDGDSAIAVAAPTVDPSQTEALVHTPYVDSKLWCSFVPLGPGEISGRIYNEGIWGESVDGSEAR